MTGWREGEGTILAGPYVRAQDGSGGDRVGPGFAMAATTPPWGQDRAKAGLWEDDKLSWRAALWRSPGGQGRVVLELRREAWDRKADREPGTPSRGKGTAQPVWLSG